MTGLEKKVSDCILYAFPDQKPGFTVALSGGRDSVCLLHALDHLRDKGMAFSLRAVHVHHGMRQQADLDEAFCHELCEKLKIPYHAVYVDVPALVEEEGASSEEAARRLRYRALSREASGDVIVLAHHQKDQAETILLHMLRGTSLKGLGGMKVLSANEFGPGRLFRPMLEVTEEELDDYVKEHQLVYRTDETNLDTGYTRNRIRKELLPQLASYNPQIIPALCAMSDSIREDLSFLEEEAEKAWRDCRTKSDEGSAIKISRLLSYPKAIQSRVLLKFLEDNGLSKDISGHHLKYLFSLTKGQSGRQIVLPKGLTVEKSYDILCIYKCPHFTAVCSENAWVRRLGKQEVLAVRSDPQKAVFPTDSPVKILSFPEEEPLPVWRGRRAGDYMMIRLADGTMGRKKLQDILQDDHVPRAKRDEAVLLCAGDKVLWIVGGRISEDVKISSETESMIQAYYDQGERDDERRSDQSDDRPGNTGKQDR
ncbi:MAG: tRNA lysidine(34) synthetase TilS [Firmicutes bacterium]|nr:tRNA lysidine(34) synthetase TilS [Bacillota bacterium]